jgi:uncharacterized protein YbjQ (UPF0145 family)
MSRVSAQVALYTVESIPVREYLGAVTFWARDDSLDVAEAQALAGLREQAAAMGGNAVIGLRIETEQELAIGSESRAGSTHVLVSSRSAYRVHASGTASRT